MDEKNMTEVTEEEERRRMERFEALMEATPDVYQHVWLVAKDYDDEMFLCMMPGVDSREAYKVPREVLGPEVSKQIEFDIDEVGQCDFHGYANLRYNQSANEIKFKGPFALQYELTLGLKEI